MSLSISAPSNAPSVGEYLGARVVGERTDAPRCFHRSADAKSDERAVLDRVGKPLPCFPCIGPRRSTLSSPQKFTLSVNSRAGNMPQSRRPGGNGECDSVVGKGTPRPAWVWRHKRQYSNLPATYLYSYKLLIEDEIVDHPFDKDEVHGDSLVVTTWLRPELRPWSV